MKSMRLALASLVGLTAAGAATAIAFAGDALADALRHDGGRFAAFAAVSCLLQLVGLKVPGRGTLAVSAVGLIGAAIALGAGPAMAIGVCCALVQWLRRRGLFHRALFDASNLALAGGAAALCYEQLAGLSEAGLVQLGAALVAGLCYVGVNVGLLCLAMGVCELRSPLRIWQERFHFARYHFLAFGALALLAASAYEQLGAAALLPFVLPPVLLALSLRESLARVRRAAVA